MNLYRFLSNLRGLNRNTRNRKNRKNSRNRRNHKNRKNNSRTKTLKVKNLMKNLTKFCSWRILKKISGKVNNCVVLLLNLEKERVIRAGDNTVMFTNDLWYLWYNEIESNLIFFLYILKIINKLSCKDKFLNYSNQNLL